ncbi:MAG TPA: family 20 glycosylhydrolase [Flavisolibacter sp.]|nr:family 20 glycosylhydrolase [Flavisolibacter sp.]
MKSKLFRSIACLAAAFSWIGSYAQISIVPQPSRVELKANADSFLLSPQTFMFAADKTLQSSGEVFSEYLQAMYGFSLKPGKRNPARNLIFLSLQKKEGLPSGSYTLETGKDSVIIRGVDAAGVFNGMQTLLQLLPRERSASLKIPAVRISDAPRFQYRGMMLDVGRHLFPVDFIKKFLDYLAFHKINYFHWHLTEDQGWRIEIKRYPRLTSEGAYRNGTITGHYPGTGNDNKRYGGFYTQAEIREVVAYAARRHITVIPEIEMPGHSSAAIASYPWLSCFPEKLSNPKKSPVADASQGVVKRVAETWGVFEDVYCAGNDSTFRFLENVLDEVMALFPSTYIHVGGDECPKTHWKLCEKCQARMKQEGLKDEQELQSYFIRRMEKYLNARGRTLIGWDEILEGGLAPNAVVMSWRSEQGGIDAARQGHPVVMTPNSHLYFDQYQAKASEEPLAIGGYNPLSKVYAYDPLPKELKDGDTAFVRGLQANLWTEYVKSSSHATYMIFPRLAALAETGWSVASQKNWDDFTKRMEEQYKRYELLGIDYSKAVYDVQQTILVESTRSRATVTLATDVQDVQLYYTLDGTEPSSASTLYTKPFVIRASALIKAAAFRDGKQVGRLSVQEVKI